MTLVQDATHVSEVAVLDITGIPSSATSDFGFGNGQISAVAQCGITGGKAICTEVLVQGTSTIEVDTETIKPTAVPVVTAKAAASNLQVTAFMGLVAIGTTLVTLF